MSHLVIKEFTHGKGKVAKVGEQVEMVKASSLAVNRLVTQGYIAPDTSITIETKERIRVSAEEAKKNFEEAKAKKEAKNGKAKIESKSEDTGKKKSGKKKSDE